MNFWLPLIYPFPLPSQCSKAMKVLDDSAILHKWVGRFFFATGLWQGSSQPSCPWYLVSHPLYLGKDRKGIRPADVPWASYLEAAWPRALCLSTWPSCSSQQNPLPHAISPYPELVHRSVPKPSIYIPLTCRYVSKQLLPVHLRYK